MIDRAGSEPSIMLDACIPEIPGGDRDGGAMIAALQQMNVPYKLDGGALSVPASRVHELRL